MTPITLTKSRTLTSVSGHNPTELATLPLEFAVQRQCKNKEVMAAIIDALCDKSRADEHIARIFSNAFQHGYLPELNQIIKNIITQHGADSVTIHRGVIEHLADDGIELICNNDGTVQMSRQTSTCSDFERHQEISRCAAQFLCGDVAKLLCAFDDEIAIADTNEQEITAIFKSGDVTAKGLIIAAASSQGRVDWLSRLFTRFQFNNWTLDLSFVELSNLDLTGIVFSGANLNGANLQDCCLKSAMLIRTDLRHANLNGANLDKALLSDADLSHARLIAASLWMTKLNNTQFTDTLLLCATIETSDSAVHLTNSICQFARIETHIYPRIYPLPYLNAVLNIVVSDDPDRPTLPGTIRQNPIVITTAEKNRLLKCGLKLDDNRNGTYRVTKPLLLHKNNYRDRVIVGALEQSLPTEVTKIISDYDDDIEICPANENALLHILRSDDRLAKAQIIVAASRRYQIGQLNDLFAQLKEENVPLDLSHVDLSNLTLHGINLNDANLTGAIMHGCNLYQATLHRARLVRANLNGASLESTEFTNANLSEARLIGANLFRAILIGTRLTRAILKFANLTKADLQGGAILRGAYLDHANLEGAIFNDADLTNASLAHAKMYLTRLDRANLTRASLRHTELVYANLTSANLTGADFSDSLLDNITLDVDPILTGTVWSGASFGDIYSDEATEKKMPLRMWMHCK